MWLTVKLGAYLPQNQQSSAPSIHFIILGNKMNKFLEYLGILILLGGIAGIIYFFLFFNTAVTTEPVTVMGQSYGGGQQVNNLGLMADRQNGIIVSLGSAILGTIFLFAGHSMTEKMNAPAPPRAGQVLETPKLCADCGKYYAGLPSFCPHCGKPQSKTIVSKPPAPAAPSSNNSGQKIERQAEKSGREGNKRDVALALLQTMSQRVQSGNCVVCGKGFVAFERSYRLLVREHNFNGKLHRRCYDQGALTSLDAIGAEVAES